MNNSYTQIDDEIKSRLENNSAALLNALPVGVLIETADNNILSVNTRLLELLDISTELEKLLNSDSKLIHQKIEELAVDSAEFGDRINNIRSHQPLSDTDEIELTDGRVLERRYTPYEIDDETAHMWIYQDVTDQKRVENNERFIDQSLDAIVTVDEDWRFVRVNERAEEVYDFTEEELRGERFWDVFSSAPDTEFEDTYREAMQTREVQTIEAKYDGSEGRSGLTGWFDITVYPRDDGGLTFFFKDISEQKKREQALAESKARFQSLTEDVLDTSEVATFILTADFEIAWINQAVEEYFGLDRDAVIGRDKADVVREEIKSRLANPDEFEETVLATYEDNTYTEEFECHLLNTDDRPERWLRHWSQPIESGYYAGGRIEHYTDITEQKKQIHQRETHIDVLDRFYEIITERDTDFEAKVTDVLELGSEYLGIPFGFLTEIEAHSAGEGAQTIVEAVGPHELLQPGETCPLSKAYCRKTIQTDDLLAIEDATESGWVDDPAYETFQLGSYIGSKVIVNGELYGTLCFAGSESREMDFSQEERTFLRFASEWIGFEIEREQARSTLEQKNDRLEEFAEVLGHDLRNPLNVAEARLELVRDEHENDHLDAVADAHDRMEALIEDLLTRARQQEDNIEAEQVSLRDVSKSCWKFFNTEDAELVCETDTTVEANPSRLKELLENLLRNSLEHAGDDVTIEIGSLPDGFYLEDDGSGIPEEQREEVLEPLYTTAEDGTGLGLNIVSDIADNHGWTFSITESKHGGARFEFTGVSTP